MSGPHPTLAASSLTEERTFVLKHGDLLPEPGEWWRHGWIAIMAKICETLHQ
jgi:hypothetical protein